MAIYLGRNRVFLMCNGKKYSVKYQYKRKFRYVSLGDSIAVGHSINSDWEKDYGYHTQYGENGNVSTAIVPNSYTYLIDQELKGIYGTDGVDTKSFAHSGDMVANLLEKLSELEVQNAIKKASIVTLSIGANDVLQPALSGLMGYIYEGLPMLAEITQEVEANLAKLNDDNNSNSYKALFDKLKSINPNATYVFTNVYNPYKYLWIDESTSGQDYKDGFFGPLMWSIPDIFGSYSNVIRKLLYDTDIVQSVFDRINGESRNGSDSLAAWTETYVTKLNTILKSKIDGYNDSKFKLVNTKTLFESVPDRSVTSEKHYNDLVNVELTKGYVIQDLDWGKFWGNIKPSDVAQILTNPEALMKDVMLNVVENVIIPDVDPHPEWYGQYFLRRSFTDGLGWDSINRYTITFNSNGGNGSMDNQQVSGVSSSVYAVLNSNKFTVPESHRAFKCWNTKPDGSGASYSDGQAIYVNSDITLYAQWDTAQYTVTIKHTMGDTISYGEHHTGPMEYYTWFIDGVETTSKLGEFSNSPRTLTKVHGTKIKVIAATASGGDMSYITLNGARVSGKASYAEYEFELTSDVTINFEWNEWQDVGMDGWIPTTEYVSYWNCYITTY